MHPLWATGQAVLLLDPGLGNTAPAMDDLLGDYEVLRAVVMTLLVAYYRARPGDTRFEKSVLAAMPAARRTNASAQLDQLVEAAKQLARRAEAERRHGKTVQPGPERAEH